MKWHLGFYAKWIEKILRQHKMEISETAANELWEIVDELKSAHFYWKVVCRKRHGRFTQKRIKFIQERFRNLEKRTSSWV